MLPVVIHSAGKPSPVSTRCFAPAEPASAPASAAPACCGSAPLEDAAAGMTSRSQPAHLWALLLLLPGCCPKMATVLPSIVLPNTCQQAQVQPPSHANTSARPTRSHSKAFGHGLPDPSMPSGLDAYPRIC